jgi:hypothetical protein
VPLIRRLEKPVVLAACGDRASTRRSR